MTIGLQNFILKTADDSFIVGHRNSEWTGFGPFIEEDIAFASMAQDKIGHAWALYKLIPFWNNQETTAEWLAFQRNPKDFLSSHFTEWANQGYDFSLIRHFLFDEAEYLRYELLLQSSHLELVHLAKKIKGELKYHTMHAETFLLQLAKGSEESKFKLQTALNEALPLALGMFEKYIGEEEVIASGIFPGENVLFEKWKEKISSLINEAGLVMPNLNDITPKFGGRNGYGSDFRDSVLSEMREVINLDPNAEW
jgi:ring-1,2-phenylacetyl-CoA epoxidase subunit PaaC